MKNFNTGMETSVRRDRRHDFEHAIIMVGKRVPTYLVGGGIMNLITTGTYNNPLAIYHEYIQNAADAAGITKDERAGRIEIELDPLGMRIRIRDDGPGLSEDEAYRALIPIADSQKLRETDRGFRGVGRLSGLAFAESVAFLTRARGCKNVTRVTWNGQRLREGINNSMQMERAVHDAITMDAISGEDYPENFFEVEVTGVARHAAGLVLNRDAVRDYVAEVCPVPFSRSFPFAEEVERTLAEHSRLPTFEITLNGDEEPVTRRHGDVIHLSGIRNEQYLEFEEIQIPSADNKGCAAIGWVAHSHYLGAISKETGIRGIRARDGNMQIGGESVFDGLFVEERFNRWCVGEIHILDPRIVPNARRDYFEPGPHTRNLENRLAAILRGIATRCRKASSMRNKGRRIRSTIQNAMDIFELATSGYLAEADASAMIKQAAIDVQQIYYDLDSAGEHLDDYILDLNEVESKLKKYKRTPVSSYFGNMSKVESDAFKRVFYALTQATKSPRIAKETIEAVLGQL